MAISTSTLPSGSVNAAYSQSLTASGGTAPYSWTVASGTLPAGLTLSTAGGLSGTPTKAGSSSFKVTVTDSAGASASASLTLTITAALAISTAATLTAGKVNVAYSATLAATGGTTPYSGWNISGGTPPPGLTLSATGILSGTPTLAGSYSFTVGVADQAGTSASSTFQLTIAPGKLAITTTSPLPAGVVGAVYSQSLVAIGGTTPYAAWTTTTGALPPGLAINPTGLLAGTPTTVGSYSFTVQVTDSASATATMALTLAITPAPLVITVTSPLPAGVGGVAYTQSLAALGGTSPYTWATTSGTLPAGLTLSSAGILSGTPTGWGTYNFAVKVTDHAGVSASASLQLTINPGPLAITTTSPLPAGLVNTTYYQAMAATGGKPPYSWAANARAPGVSFTQAGVWSGTPTAPGIFSFTIQVADSAGTTASALFELIVSPNSPLAITAASLPPGNVNTNYSASITAKNGTPPYVGWTITTGTLPPGLTLSQAGVLSGIPTSTGTSSFTVQVTDSAGVNASAPFQLTVNPAKLVVTTALLAPGQVSAAYSQSLGANGGVPPYTWLTYSVMPGLTLSTAGVLSGTPTVAGSTNIVVQVTDSAAATATAAYQLLINPPPPSITTPSLLVGQVGAAYSQSLAATGGTPPYTWAANNNAPGLTFSASGVLSGTPTNPGIYSLTVQVTDKTGTAASTPFQLTINAAALAITTSSPLAGGRVNIVYSLALAATGGTLPYANWTVSSGTLPPGLTLSATGVLNGTPTTAGSYPFTVQVTDKAGATASTAFQLTIAAAAPAITTASPLPVGNVNTGYSQSLAATGGTPPYTNWAISTGTLPSGVTLSSAGVLSGTPTTAGTYSFTVQVTDNAGATAFTAFQLTISPIALTITTTSPLPAGHVNSAYFQALAASGGMLPYANWATSNSTLPAGLSLNTAGVLSGTPTKAGAYSFTIQVTDKGGATASTPFQLTIAPPAPTIATASPLPAGKVNTAYTLTLGASGGTPPYTNWATSNGALPPGLTLSPAGVLSGTPTTAGTYSFTVQVTDTAGATGSAQFQLTITSLLPPAITTASPLPAGKANTAYSLSVGASGGTPPYTGWTTSSGTLPPGLTFSSAGVFGGTPTTAGAYSFTIQVTDSAGATASAPFQLTISSALQLPSVVAAVSSASSVGGLAVTTGSWVALYGTNLAPAGDSRTWNSSTEIVNGSFPTSLDGTSVTVNGKAATVEYISPGQVNIQMPDDTATGPVPVVVTTTAGGASSSFTVSYAPFSPGFFPGTAPYIVAQHADNSYVTTSAPALPGEVIVLWGGGMGPANPAIPSGRVFSGANPLANTVTVTIGGQPAALDFAGLVGAGLVQINAHVPAGIGSGDQAVVATVGGVSSPSGAYIRVGTASAAISHLRGPEPASDNLAHVIQSDVVTVTRAIVPPSPIYAGTDSGIYKSSDGGATWQQSMSSPGALSAIHSIVVDRRDTARIYAAGMNYSGGDTFFTSLDAGQTWSSASAPPAATLALDATSTNVIYLLGVLGGGVYRSVDSGQTWNPTTLTNIGAIAADPGITGIVYATASSGQNQLLKSYDFGMTWTPIAIGTVPEGISALAIDPHDSNTLYAVSSPRGVFRSTDGGNTWEDIRSRSNLYGDSLLPFAAYSVKNKDGGKTAAVATVFTDPGNSGNWYVLPELPSVSGESNGLFRSTDGGASWSFSPVVPGRGHVFSLGVSIK